LWSGVFLKARAFVPLGPVGSEAFQALRVPLCVEPRERDRLAASVDAFHQVFVRHQLGLAAHRDVRLDPRARSRRSSLAHLRVVRIPVGSAIAALGAVVVEALTGAFVRGWPDQLSPKRPSPPLRGDRFVLRHKINYRPGCHSY
jgi:hypothetical protein